ncbi:MAG: carboxypeptidase-like regulatory domain-containing protein, partial [Bacteroidota bacterium]|nr:carboxypeptidase-like regulatory domain-containing protein [Bacteroidota bacterium]
MRRILLTFFSMVSLMGLAQNEEENQEIREITATVVNAQTDFPLESVHVINLNLVKGTITNQNGKFTIPAAVNDTLYLSYLGFKTQKIRVTNDMFRYGDTKIALTELAYALEEVIVRPYQLTGYLEIDVKNLPINNSQQYSI